MWQRILGPWILLCSLVDLIFSGAIAYFLVVFLEWRYVDWLGLNPVPYSAFQSIVVYAIIGAILWPVFGLLIAWLSISNYLHNRNRTSQRRHASNTMRTDNN